jgi:aminotransferase
MISVFGSMVGEEEIEKVAECMRSQWMGFGKNVEAFEKEFSEKFGLKNFAMVDSGSNALYMAVKLLDLPPHSEIILPSFTWVSCAQAILLCGHKPVFCDVDIRTMNIRKEDIEAYITKRTGAIMVVHYGGLAVDIELIKELGFPIIEDAAHAVCSTYQGEHCGGLADIGIYSFDAIKNLTTGEGGGITCKDMTRIERAKVLRYCGIGKSGFDAAISDASKKSRWWEYNIQEPFIKMLPTNIAAAIGIVQLRKLGYLQERRKAIWNFYQQEFANIPNIKTPADVPTGEKHSYFTYCLRLPKRDELAHYLLEQGIYTTLRYHPLHLNPVYWQISKHLPNTERLNEEALSIPIHPRLTDTEVQYIVDKIKQFYKN